MSKRGVFRQVVLIGIIACFVGVSIGPTVLGYNPRNTMKTIYVDDDLNECPDADYTNIQDAINNASDEDTIFVYIGEYSQIKVNKSVTIIGEDKKSTIIKANENKITADYVVLSGFNLYGKSPGLDNVLTITGDYASIYNCILHPTNDYNPSMGIEIDHCKHTTISNCDILDFVSWGITINQLEGPGISTDNCLIENCDIKSSYRGICILGCDGGGHSIVNCTIYDCGDDDYGSAIYSPCMHTLIDNCSFYDNDRGVDLYCSSENIVSNCFFYDNNIGCIIRDPFYGGDFAVKNKLISNTFAYNNIGIRIINNCYNNILYHNNFVNNLGYNALDNGNNIWDNGYPSGGNYWSDYTGIDDDGDGIGDTSYYIPNGNNIDRYPLMDLDVSIQPPQPNLPVGPTEGKKNIIYNFSTSVKDPNNDQLFYNFSWGDGNYTGWLGPFDSGEICEVSYSWSISRIYNVKVIAKDSNDMISKWSGNLGVKISVPSAPILNGTIRGKPGEEYVYTIVSIDPDGDDLDYHINWYPWGDQGWYGPYKSGEIITVNYTFSSRDEWWLVVRARDSEGAVGEKTKLVIQISKSKSSTDIALQTPKNKLFNYKLYFLERLLDRFSLFARLLRL